MEYKKFEFEKPKLKNNESWLIRTLFTKTALFIILGIISSSLYYYYTEWQFLNNFSIKDSIEGVSMGALIGYFLANNPCANNKC
ncbi:MAG: hypothetical protein KAH10_01000 [Flavobacteriales bacterium]|nr:hypothetical protein [Flavobacteriales bacterium]